MDNLVEIKSKSYTCQSCKTGNQQCRNCKNMLREDNFYYWLILTKLTIFPDVRIQYANNLANKASKIIELFKSSVGLQEKSRKMLKSDCTKLDLKCTCGNTMTLFVLDEKHEKEYTCMMCKSKSFKIIDSSPARIEKIEIVLEKLSAVRAATERR